MTLTREELGMPVYVANEKSVKERNPLSTFSSKYRGRFLGKVK